MLCGDVMVPFSGRKQPEGVEQEERRLNEDQGAANLAVEKFPRVVQEIGIAASWATPANSETSWEQCWKQSKLGLGGVQQELQT